ncbi:MFS transporter [Actinoplanes derwentensis]|uniref:Predicted arabinose efflux permease, MFS family n=1 Tax=Actinoplanes derwentensis TaxID=113562 RepID=A0A1H2BGB1_9ACTN|nr:MFS transporter [Actinoplanes derwentensis]GID87785.1 MFS transporter [Actinoplanes derwentensis]SDT57117.1 Predicted arabinose efflux permease, MFS family [Actinoplanes derwentensis]
MTATADQTLRQLGPTIYLPAAVWSTGLGAVAPVIVLTATSLGASPATAAVVAGMLGLGQISGSLPAGVLISRIGERRTMMAASALAVPALVACMLAPNVLLLGVAVALLGVCGAAWMLARLAYMTEAVRPELRARAMSTLGGVGRIGTFSGPFLGAGAMHLAGLDGAYLVAIAGVSLATLILIMLPSVPHDRAIPAGTERPGLWTVIRAHQRTLRTLGVAVLLVGALRASRQTILPLWGASLGLDPATIGLIYGLSGGIDMLLFYPAGKLMDVYGRRAAAVPALILLGLAHLLLPLAGGAVGLTAAALLMGVGNGLSAGLVMTLGADASPTAGRAEFLGAWRLCSDVGVGGGPLLIGAVTAVFSLTAAALTVGGAGLLAATLLQRWIPGTSDAATRGHPASQA